MLALKQASGSTWWGQPGGEVERDELPAETVQRETLEETGLGTSKPELLRSWHYMDRRGERIDCFAFAAKAQPGDVILSSEHSDYAWLSIDEYAETYCSEPAGWRLPGWATAFLAEMRTNCKLARAWFTRNTAG